MSDKTGIHTNMKIRLLISESMLKHYEKAALNIKVIPEERNDTDVRIEIEISDSFDIQEIFFAGALWAESIFKSEKLLVNH
jgi:hypothetical protein